MHKLIIIFISSFILPYGAFGQEEDWKIERREKAKFVNTLDSLFLANKYEQIIELGTQSHPDYLQTTCTYNLIGAYYFLGDSVKSWELLNKEIERIKSYPDADAYALTNIFSSGDFSSFKKFMINSSVKSYVVDLMDSFYMTESASDKEKGLELIHLLVEDQWVRRISSLYDKLSPERRFPLPSQMDSMQAIQAQHDHCTKVFNFYKKHNKIFSKAEVGRIYGWQMLLFFHEWDLERRDFYHELVIEGVKNGTLKMDDRANFEAGTAYIKLGVDEFFKRRAELEESYKKKYSLPDNYRIRLM